MAKECAKSIRDAVAYLDTKNDLKHVEKEVDIIYEIAGIQKALDEGPVLFFENIKRYPKFRNTANFFSRRDRLADIFDSDIDNLKFKFVDAIKKQLPNNVVEDAPCQEVVITDEIDVPSYLPIIKHTARDAGRI